MGSVQKPSSSAVGRVLHERAVITIDESSKSAETKANHLALKILLKSESAGEETTVELSDQEGITYSISSGLLETCKGAGESVVDTVKSMSYALWNLVTTGSYPSEITDSDELVKQRIVDYIQNHPEAISFVLPVGPTSLEFEATDNMSYIASGSFGNVYKVNSIAMKPFFETVPVEYAMKIPANEGAAVEDVKSEISFIHELHKRATPEERKKIFPYVHSVKYKGQEGYLTELYSGTLQSYIEKYKPSLEEKIQIASQLMEQMAIISKYKGIYTDIKTANIFFKGTKPIKVVLADFGNCHFADKRETITYGFTFSPAFMCMKDRDLFRNWEWMTEEDLQKNTEQHQARALGLVLCSLFSGEDSAIVDLGVLFSGNYLPESLENYFNNEHPLASLKAEHPELFSIIEQMLGVNKQPTLTPQEAWEKWNHIVQPTEEAVEMHMP